MDNDQPAYTVRGRVGNRRDRFRLYILLNSNRLLLTGILTSGVFGCFLLLGASTPFRQFMVNMGPTRYMFQALVGELIIGVTLVVTITQLVLSQEIGPLGTQRERMSNAMNFRGDVEAFFGSISPPEPESFLQALIDNSHENAETLQQTVADNANGDLVHDVSRFTNYLSEHAEEVGENLEDQTFGEYAVVKAVLDYNYGEKIYQAR